VQGIRDGEPYTPRPWMPPSLGVDKDRVQAELYILRPWGLAGRLEAGRDADRESAVPWMKEFAYSLTQSL